MVGSSGRHLGVVSIPPLAVRMSPAQPPAAGPPVWLRENSTLETAANGMDKSRVKLRHDVGAATASRGLSDNTPKQSK